MNARILIASLRWNNFVRYYSVLFFLLNFCDYYLTNVGDRVDVSSSARASWVFGKQLDNPHVVLVIIPLIFELIACLIKGVHLAINLCLGDPSFGDELFAMFIKLSYERLPLICGHDANIFHIRSIHEMVTFARLEVGSASPGHCKIE